MVYIKVILFVIYPIICYFLLAKWLYKQEFKKLKTVKEQYNELETKYNQKLSDEYLEFKQKLTNEFGDFQKELRVQLSDLNKDLNSKNKEYLDNLRKEMSGEINRYLLEMNNSFFLLLRSLIII